ncbi:MAG: hypothetical protein FWG34_11375 [Oscillospiraceae bacterium]|nr:hypothetical protein [Oscillospiraceae bacterium]
MLTQRLGLKTQKDERFIDDLLDAALRHPGCLDEVWLATEYGFPPISVHEKTALSLAKTAKRFREAGIRVSLQVSNTIGHGEYMKFMDCTGLVHEGSPAEKMVGPDGTEAGYCFCWNGGHFREYTEETAALYAKLLQPHAIWFDDDLRAGNHNPVNYGCFCDCCIKKFNALHDSKFMREELVHEINFGEPVWRRRFVAFIRDGLREFAKSTAKAAIKQSPESRLGYQHGSPGGYAGYGLEYIFDALREAGGKQIMSRPGGGAYDDHDPGELLKKSFHLSWQNRMLPDYVAERRPEIENLPYAAYGKTAGGTCLETALYLASGSTAMSYAMLMFDHEPMAWHEKTLARFAFHRPYWQRLSERSKNTRQAGLQLVLHKHMWEKKLAKGEENFNWAHEPIYGATVLARTGIPLSFDETHSPVYLLHEDMAATLDDGEVTELLAAPVVTSGAALALLSKRGFRFGASAEAVSTRQVYEIYTSHPVNGESGGRTWNQFFSFAFGYRLIDLDGNTEVLGRYASDLPDLGEGDLPHGIANAIVQTGAGAKWAVFGYTPWNAVISHEKRNQILRAADYIGKNRMPAYISTPQQAILLPREDEYGNTASVSVLNCTIDESEELDLIVRRPAGTRAVWVSQSCPAKEANLPIKRREDGWLVRPPILKPWEIGTVFVEK